MEYRFLITDPTGAPLGDPKAVLALLEEYLPDVRAELCLTGEPHHKPSSLFHILQNFLIWLQYGRTVGNPQYSGYILGPGCEGGFVFGAISPLKRVSVTMFADPDQNPYFAKLFAKTGWVRTQRKWYTWFHRL